MLLSMRCQVCDAMGRDKLTSTVISAQFPHHCASVDPGCRKEVKRGAALLPGQAWKDNILKQLNHMLKEQVQKLNDDVSQRAGNKAQITASRKWDWQPATFFTLTVVATIGYGQYVPRTDGGKIFTAFLIILGAPVYLAALKAVSDVYQMMGTWMLQQISQMSAFKRMKHDTWCRSVVLRSTMVAFLLVFWVLGAYQYEYQFGFTR